MDSHRTAVLAGARSLAARGDREAALELLEQIPAPDGAALRARILCQQGRFAEGAQWWREALAADPQNDEVRQGLALAESLARARFGRARLHSRRWLLALAALAIAVALSSVAATPSQEPSSRELADSIARLERSVAALNSAAQDRADSLALRLDQGQGAAAQSNEQLRVQVQRLQQSLRRVERTLAEQPR